MSTCVAFRCDAPAGVTGLCRAHQRRLDSGGGLPTANELFTGDLSGHGRYGIIDVSDVGILCHECGERFASVAQHVLRTHQLDPGDYRLRHGLQPRQSLGLPRDGTVRRRPKMCSCGAVFTTPGKRCQECRRKNPLLGQKDN